MRNRFREQQRPAGLRSILAALLVTTALVAVAGCAYFNLFYNAEKSFSEAERIGKDVDPRNQPTGQQRGEYQRAIRKCKLLLEEYPNSDLVDDALFLIGKSHYRIREWSEAIRHFNDVLANFPGSEYEEESMYLLSLCHLGRGEEDQALQWLARLRESYPEGRLAGEALFDIGGVYEEAGRHARAESSYQNYLANYGGREDASRVRVALARVRLEMGKSDEAVEALAEFDVEKALELDPDLVFDAERLRILAYLESSRAQEALERLPALDVAVQDPSQERRAKLLRGRVSLLLGDIEAGVSTIDELATDAVSFPEGTEARAVAIEFFGEREGPEGENYQLQLAAASEVKRLIGDYADVISDHAKKYARYQAAALAYAKDDSTQDASTKAAYAFELGELAFTDYERFGDAARWYETAVEIDPAAAFAPRALYALAWLSTERLDDIAAGERWIARLEADFPDSPQARASRGEEFLVAKPRTREELEALAARRPGGAGAADDPSLTTDPRLNPRRSLRLGGPGATMPRERRSG